MSLGRFYCPALAPGSVVLPEEESHHAIASLRAVIGDEVILFDGAGGEASGRIERIESRQVQVAVGHISHHGRELPIALTIAVAMVRAHRQAYLIEKCTELGAAAIWPMTTERSVAKPSASSVVKWRRRAIEAAKQSHRRWVPTIEPPQSFASTLGQVQRFDAFALAHPDGAKETLAAFLSGLRNEASVLVWVGPEGGWTDAERDQAIRAGAAPVSLSPTVLRTETAAVAACAAAAMLGAAHANPGAAQG
ncbi:MAG: 16S rRNA (uracil(1498)-N(3))-methyltransferase [Planctomycetes bacterium]|nr:16S rRNA (uracil(1498)-N(3))-methyltransferase [Planctomycetota bacterium]